MRFSELMELPDDKTIPKELEDIQFCYSCGITNAIESNIDLCEWNIEKGYLDDAFENLKDIVRMYNDTSKLYVCDLIESNEKIYINKARPQTYLTDLQERSDELDATKGNFGGMATKLKKIVESLADAGYDIIDLHIEIGGILLYYNNRQDVRCFLSEEDISYWKKFYIDNSTPSGIYPCKVTAENITKLNPNEIFVFGSNLQGKHDGGTANSAVRHFGAVMGQGVGLQGRSYAIPTMHGGVETIRPYIDDFIHFALRNPNLDFLVTKIGCGIAGFKPEDIAPLFKEAVKLVNVSLPVEFIDVITSMPAMPVHMRKKIYGQTRTLVDMLCEMNQERHFSSTEEMLEAIQGFIDSLRSGDEVAWSISYQSLAEFAKECFTPDGLDIDKLQTMLDRSPVADGAFKRYVIEKTIKLIEILNEVRRYTDPKQLEDDIFHALSEDSFKPKPNYFGFGSPHGGYIQFFFRNYITRFWSEIAPNGVLDNTRFKDFMYERHARAVDKYGIQSVIRRNFEYDSPCHTEVYVAYRGGAAPVYVEDVFIKDAQENRANRCLIKSCGEGKGPNAIPDLFEFSFIRNLIEHDSKYVTVTEKTYYDSILTYYVPKEDFSLPVYGDYGKLNFINDDVKRGFIMNKLSNIN